MTHTREPRLYCTSQSDDGYLCTLNQDHRGDHVAHGPQLRVLATWPKSIQPPRGVLHDD